VDGYNKGMEEKIKLLKAEGVEIDEKGYIINFKKILLKTKN
jgi:hypothetical protein